VGASLSLGLSDRGALRNRGRQSAKGYPFSGGVFDTPFQGFCGPRLDRLQRAEMKILAPVAS
jgi:hypothetical protein